MDAGSEFGLLPCGLWARDTLRLEMGYLLYGNDIDEGTNPFEAGYAGVLDFENTEFIGRVPLARIKNDLPEKRLAGLMMTGKGIPRHSSLIRASGLGLRRYEGNYSRH
jgi:aminomethyltransferase